ncbi:MAG: acetylxylan esterase [Phycisphaerae bacterium]|nr:acetylxylan esterase [Phycisphaerae bacterium]
MRNRIITTCVLLSIVIGSPAAGEENLNVLPDKIDGVARGELLKVYFQQQVDEAWKRWQAEYEKLKTPEQIADYQKQRKQRFIEAIGGLPERTPLNPRVTGKVQRDGFRVEKIVFESQPGIFVTACLFLPDSPRHKPPYPGVLVPCGHSHNGKAYDSYQRISALLALNGFAALIYDPIDQGERVQLFDDKGKPKLVSVAGHDMLGIGCILLGRNTARFRIWDGMRALDYLQSRPEVDPKRIGCTGNSGGGTLTSYLMALDDRIIASAPSCYLTNLPTLIRTIGPQDAEQNIRAQLAFGMDQADYILMRAPKPTIILAATQDFFDIGGTWVTLRYAKRLYSRMGLAERVDIIEVDDKHGFHQPQREASVRWMMRWLLGKDEPITEPDIKVLGEQEIWAAPNGRVMQLDGAKTLYELNADYETQLAAKRKQRWSTGKRAELLEQVRRIAGIRKLSELPQPQVDKVGKIQRDACTIEKLVLKPEPGLYLPALLFAPNGEKDAGVTLYLHESGKADAARPGGAIEALVRAGQKVLAVDVRGVGETALKNWRHMNTPYLLGRSLMGMQAEDILTSARYAQGLSNAKAAGGVDLVAVGQVCVPALHAAAVECGLFKSIKLSRPLVSWSNAVHTWPTKDQWPNVVHGALEVYDLPDLASTLGAKLEIDRPANAIGQAVERGW